jgi:hypothetical protein
MRDLILYVTIDDEDYLTPGHPRYAEHLPNLTRLRVIARQDGLRVEPVYMAGLTEERLKDAQLLALFGAGSFPEWHRQIEDERWARRLRRYASLLRHLTVPMLAVCGSHQFVVAAFQGWSSVGHMMPEGAPLVTVAEELREQRSLVPTPRMGEIGIFPLRKPRGNLQHDPILEGLPEPLRFVQHHYDIVIAGRHSRFHLLLEPSASSEPIFWASGTPGHRDPVTREERSSVQLLRLDDPNRILYSAQFHPELPSQDPEVDALGERFLRNFFRLARADREQDNG